MAEGVFQQLLRRKLQSHSLAILHDVIDVDDGDDSEDLVIIGEKFSKSNKGKTIEATHQVVDVSNYTFCPPGVDNFGPASLHDVLDIVDSDDSEDLVIIGEKVSKSNKGKTIEAIHQVMEVSNYAFCQPGMKNFGPAILHNVIDIDDDDDPDDLVVIEEVSNKSNKGKAIEAIHQVVARLDSPWYDTHSDAKNSLVTDSSQPSWSLEPSNSRIQGSTMGSSNLQNKMDNVEQSYGTKLSFPQLLSQAVPSKKKSAASQRSGHGLSISLGVKSSKSKRLLKSFGGKMKSASFGSKNHGLAGNPEARKLLHADKPPAATTFESAKKEAGSSSSYHANFKEEILRKIQSFKQFDIVGDTSDHHFIHENSSMQQHPQNWAKVIRKEWKILEKDLPDSIFVRVYESRMDLLRAVIIGAEGTPYHDALFFFDLYFPGGYPNVPPLVYFVSRGFSLNPNLYFSGKVCLSLLLNTVGGYNNERWLPGISTILQVLVSIQGLVLNANPFFNEPGMKHMTDSAKAERMSLKFNENTFLQSLQIMIHIIRRPPKNFEDFVVGHFMSRAHDILVACNAYMEGVQVGCLVKGGVQDVDEGDKRCSNEFRFELARCMKDRLVGEFARFGAKDCEKFLFAANKMFWNLLQEKLNSLKKY